MGTALTSRQKELVHHEEIVADGLKAFQYIGDSLRTIRDDKLYQDGYETFEDYCRERWGIVRSRAYQFIEAYQVIDEMSKILDKSNGTKTEKIEMPRIESHAMALASCADDDKQRVQVWKETLARADGKPVTAKMIKDVADEILPPRVKEDGSKARRNGKKDNSESNGHADSSDPPVSEFRGPPIDPILEGKRKSFDNIRELISAMSSVIQESFDNLVPLMKSVDQYNSDHGAPNHKAIEAQYRSIFDNLKNAVDVVKKMQTAWDTNEK